MIYIVWLLLQVIQKLSQAHSQPLYDLSTLNQIQFTLDPTTDCPPPFGLQNFLSYIFKLISLILSSEQNYKNKSQKRCTFFKIIVIMDLVFCNRPMLDKQSGLQRV